MGNTNDPWYYAGAERERINCNVAQECRKIGDILGKETGYGSPAAADDDA